MSTAFQLGAAFVFVAILLAAGMVLAAFQLGRLVTRDDEQREVDVARTRGCSGMPICRRALTCRQPRPRAHRGDAAVKDGTAMAGSWRDCCSLTNAC
jgi:hypothetical protein